MAWWLLVVAVVSEVVGTLSLRARAASGGWGWLAAVVLGYGIAFVLLGMVLRDLPVGPVYAVWSGLGTAGALLGGWLLFGERITPVVLLGVLLVVAGVVVLRLGVTGGA